MARLPPPREREPPVAQTPMPTEVELKLALDAAAVPALLRHPALRPLRRGRTRTARVVSTYFDSRDFRLQRAEVALRVRRIGRRWIQTVKGPPQAGAGAGLHVRPEHEWPLPGPRVEPGRLAATPWKKLTTKIAKDGGLVPCFTTDFTRRTIPLEFPDGSTAEFCVDLGEIRATRDGRTRREPIAEIEIELGSGDAANLFRLALALSADLPLAAMTEYQGRARLRAAPRVAARRGLAGARAGCAAGDRRDERSCAGGDRARVPAPDRRQRSGTRRRRRSRMDSPDARRNETIAVVPRAARALRARCRARPGGGRGQVARSDSGQGARLGRVRDGNAAAARGVVRP